MEIKPLLTLGPMARRLRVPVNWLREEATSGRLPHIRAGKVFLFNADTVEKILIKRASAATYRQADHPESREEANHAE
jgi:excisionase family DNA binding protein